MVQGHWSLLNLLSGSENSSERGKHVLLYILYLSKSYVMVLDYVRYHIPRSRILKRFQTPASEISNYYRLRIVIRDNSSNAIPVCFCPGKNDKTPLMPTQETQMHGNLNA